MKSWMEHGCTCQNCLKHSEDEYSYALELWNSGVRDIKLWSWDNLPESYGTTMIINNIRVGEVESNILGAIELLCEFLGIDGVKTGYVEDDPDTLFDENK